MPGPSDAFFRDIVKTVGGKLAQGLPELEKRQAAARALGTQTGLADVAVALGLMDASKVEQLAALERGEAPPAAPVVPAPSKTPSTRAPTPEVTTVGTRSSGKTRVPVCSACKVPLAMGDVVAGTGRCAKCDGRSSTSGSQAGAQQGLGGKPIPVKKRLRDRAKMISSVAIDTLQRLNPRKRRRANAGEAPAEPPQDNTAAIAIVGGGLAIALLLITIAVIIATRSRVAPPAPPPPPKVIPPPPPVQLPQPPALPPPPPVERVDPDEERRGRLGMIAATAVSRAKAGDFPGAEERLGTLRAAAWPEDQQIVDDAARQVLLLKNKPKLAAVASDEELRELARDSTPAGRITHARALERLGRRDEALDALIPGREDSEVRRVLGGYPAWRDTFGDAGATGWADLSPPRPRPRTRWRVPGLLDPARAERLNFDLVANPFVVVATRTASSLAGIDAVTGAVLWERPFESRRDGRASLDGDAIVLVATDGLFVLDAWTGVERLRAPIPNLASRWLGDLVLSLDGDTIVAWDRAGARRWTTRVPVASPDMPGFFRGAGDHVLVKTAGHIVALDAATGAIQWDRRGFLVCADRDGALVVVPGRDGSVMSLLDATGETRARFENVDAHRAMSPTTVIAISGIASPEASFVALDRATGARSGPLLAMTGYSATALTRDVLLVGKGVSLHAFSARERLWFLDITPMESAKEVYLLAPGHRCVTTIARDGTVTCYEEG